MRASAAGSMKGPMSFTTSRATGDFGCAAATMPSSPPIDVPIQSTFSAPVRAISAVNVVRYVGIAAVARKPMYAQRDARVVRGAPLPVDHSVIAVRRKTQQVRTARLSLRERHDRSDDGVGFDRAKTSAQAHRRAAQLKPRDVPMIRLRSSSG